MLPNALGYQQSGGGYTSSQTADGGSLRAAMAARTAQSAVPAMDYRDWAAILVAANEASRPTHAAVNAVDEMRQQGLVEIGDLRGFALPELPAAKDGEATELTFQLKPQRGHIRVSLDAQGCPTRASLWLHAVPPIVVKRQPSGRWIDAGRL